MSVNEDINLADNPVIAHIRCVYFFLYVLINLTYNSKYKKKNYRATDADAGANAAIRYAIIGGNTQLQFSIDSLSGDVSLVKPLDYEILRNYRLIIRAQGS